MYVQEALALRASFFSPDALVIFRKDDRIDAADRQ